MTPSSEHEDTALAHLRRATAAHHAQLESVVESLGLFRSVDAYARHLTLLFNHCASNQARLSDQPELQALVTERQHELHTDLRRLGKAPELAQPVQGAPLTRAQCLGFTYVTEGSRLGAAAISKRLNHHGIVAEDFVTLSRPPALVRQRWLDYCRQLTSLPKHEWSTASATAVESFVALTAEHRASAGNLVV